MKRKFIMIGFFLIVFALPVGWYLFLQFFGKNEFALPVLDKWNETCAAIDTPTLIIAKGSFELFPNQKKRIEIHLKDHGSIKMMEVGDCDLSASMYLVDDSLRVRGVYEVNREETDRLIAEIDVYLSNLYQ